jgi:hypothetical protein
VSMCACARKNGWKEPAWYQRVISSVDGLPKKPPPSAPANVRPETPGCISGGGGNAVQRARGRAARDASTHRS